MIYNTRILVLYITTVLWRMEKKSGKNKNKLRTIYPQNYEDFKNNKAN